MCGCPGTEDTYQTDEGPISVGMDAAFLRNEGGDWACSTGYLVKGSTPNVEVLTESSTYTCVGSGGYEGLSAVLVIEPAEGFSTSSPDSSSPVTSLRCPKPRLPSRAAQLRSSSETPGPSVLGQGDPVDGARRASGGSVVRRSIEILASRCPARPVGCVPCVASLTSRAAPRSHDTRARDPSSVARAMPRNRAKSR